MWRFILSPVILSRMRACADDFTSSLEETTTQSSPIYWQNWFIDNQ